MITEPPDIRADPADASRLLELSAERDQQARLRREAERQAYRLGFREGWTAAVRAEDRAWAATPTAGPVDGTALDELEARRWTVRGEQRTRETFSAPHPADYRGRENAA